MSWEEQDAVDHDGRNLFAIAPGHQIAGREHSVVLWGNDRFTVVDINVH